MTIGNYSQLNMLGLGSGMNYQNFFSSCGMGSFNIGSLLNGGLGCGTSMYNCDGSYNYDKAAGMAVGGFLLNMLGGIASDAMAKHQAKKAESPEQTYEALTKQVSEQQSVVDNKKQAVDTAKAKVDGVKADIITLSESIATLSTELESLQNDSTYIANKAKLAELLAKVDQEGVDQANLKASIDIVKGEIEPHEKKITDKQNEIKTKEAEKKSAEDSIEVTGTLGRALQAAQEDYETENDKLTTLQKKLAEATASKNDKTLDNADGHKWQQTKFETLKDKFDNYGNIKQGNKVSKSDLRCAIQMYRNTAGTPEQKEWTKKFNKLWNTYVNTQGEDPGSDLKAARDLIPNR